MPERARAGWRPSAPRCSRCLTMFAARGQSPDRSPTQPRAASFFRVVRLYRRTGCENAQRQRKRIPSMKTAELENDVVKQAVRERYGQIAEQGGSCGCGTSCCSPSESNSFGEPDTGTISKGLGYSADDVT